MAAEVGDRTKPVAQRLAAANELKSLQDKYAEINGGKPVQAAPQDKPRGATGSWGNKPAPPKPMKGMVRGGYKFKGGDPANQANWEAQ